MNSSTSSSRGSARLFLASMLGGVVLAVAAASAAPESWIHSGPEYGMAEAFEDHIQKACADKLAPGMLIIGDSRAVAGLSVAGVRAAGIDAEKFALGGSGIFAGWAALDRLVDCGVRPKMVVMAYGTIHMLDSGAMMERTANYDIPKGPRASHVYAMASAWEDRLERKLTYKAVSMVGTEASLLDFVLMRPALRTVLASPSLALQHHAVSEGERADFTRKAGDRYYGLADGTSDLPEEAAFEGAIRPVNLRASEAIAELGRKNGFNVQFYILPVSEAARAKLKPEIFAMAEDFRSKLGEMGIEAINDIWTLPDADFGDPSHVNARGRVKVTADFLHNVAEDASLAKSEAAGIR